MEGGFFVHILDILFPKRCVGCGRFGRYICASCSKLVIPISPNECICPVCGKPAIAGATHPRCRARYTPDGLTSFFYYNDVVRKAIKTLKYRFVSDLASELMAMVPMSSYEIRAVTGDPDGILLPMPLHVFRMRHRGFNQSEILGKLVAGQLRIRERGDILGRTKETVPQATM